MTRVLVVFLFVCVATALGGYGHLGPAKQRPGVHPAGPHSSGDLEERMFSGRRCWCEPVWGVPYGRDGFDDDVDMDPRILFPVSFDAHIGDYRPTPAPQTVVVPPTGLGPGLGYGYGHFNPYGIYG